MQNPIPHRRDPRQHLVRLALLVGILGAGLLGVGLLAPGLAFAAEDDRPQEIPFAGDGEIPLLDSNYKRDKHKVVLITDNRLSPRRVVLEKGELVAWISYSRAPSRVVFEREVARDMICHSLVNFTLKEDELTSAEINAGEFASFCQLKPGRYSYKVVREVTDNTRSVDSRLDGEIVVAEE